MWPGYDGRIYTREQFQSHVDKLTIPPFAKFMVMHATGSPTLAQWDAGDESRRLANLQRYYEKQLHWSHGPHLFIGPDHICGFSDLRVRGTHCSCWNGISIGVETAGNWNTEDFESGRGAMVRDNFIFAAAVIHKKLGLRAGPFEMGVKGLHLHLMCKRDGHTQCPKVGFDRDRMADLIDAQIDKLGPVPAPSSAGTYLPRNARPAVGTVAWIQGALNVVLANQLTVLLKIDGDMGPKTEEAIKMFQHVAHLHEDGICGKITLPALQVALANAHH